MDAKLKALKVADLKALLSKASVSIPSKSKKDDLIGLVLANPAALDLFNGKGEASEPEPAPVHAPEAAAPEPASEPTPAPEPVAEKEAPAPAPAPVLGKRARDGALGDEDVEMKSRTPPPPVPAAQDAVATVAMDEDSDDDVGPMPMPAEASANGGVKKKRKGVCHTMKFLVLRYGLLNRLVAPIVLPHEQLYLDHLPNTDQYYKSFMHREVVNFSVATKYAFSLCILHCTGYLPYYTAGQTS